MQNKRKKAKRKGKRSKMKDQGYKIEERILK